MTKSDYSPHDWRKNTDNAVVVDENKAMLKVNECKVYFTNPKTLKVHSTPNIFLVSIITVGLFSVIFSILITQFI